MYVSITYNLVTNPRSIKISVSIYRCNERSITISARRGDGLLRRRNRYGRRWFLTISYAMGRHNICRQNFYTKILINSEQGNVNNLIDYNIYRENEKQKQNDQKAIILIILKQYAYTVFLGFSKTTPWIKIQSNHEHINVQNETIDKKSYLSFFKSLTALRRTPTFKRGGLDTYIFNDTVYVLTR